MWVFVRVCVTLELEEKLSHTRTLKKSKELFVFSLPPDAKHPPKKKIRPLCLKHNAISLPVTVTQKTGYNAKQKKTEGPCFPSLTLTVQEQPTEH